MRNKIDPAVVEEFARQLRIVRRRAGDPSYREMTRRSYKGIKRYEMVTHSTINRALTGKHFPKWDVVELVLDVCHADPATRAAIEKFWFDALDAVNPLGDLAGSTPAAEAESPLPPGHECDSCGAWVTNDARHQRWHGDYVSRNTLRVVGGAS